MPRIRRPNQLTMNNEMEKGVEDVQQKKMEQYNILQFSHNIKSINDYRSIRRSDHYLQKV